MLERIAIAGGMIVIIIFIIMILYFITVSLIY